MRIGLIGTLIFSLLLSSGLPTAQPASANSLVLEPIHHAAPTKAQFALLVGIDEYIDKNVPDLSGCENDAKLMRAALKELYGFKPNTEIRELLSSNKKPADMPTQKGILDAFDKHLIENAKKYLSDNKLEAEKDAGKGATIVFYYSGHGSYLPDDAETKDESDGQDETIVPMDSDGTRDIRDDEFDKRFAELRKYTTNITFIFDSCHSGTITRGGNIRSIRRPSKQPGARGEGETLNESMDSAGESYVTISGSLPNEYSQENLLPVTDLTIEKLKLNQVFPGIKAREERQNGYMTYFLVQELINSPDATYREIMQRVKTAVTKNVQSQHPQVEGDMDRVFLGSAASRGKRAIPITEVRRDGKNSVLTIEAGRIVGAFPGGSVGIYDSKARELTGDTDRLAEGEIIDPTGDFAATVLVRDKDIPQNAKIILATPYFGDNKRLVALDLFPVKDGPAGPDAGAAMMKKLADRLKDNAYVETTTLSIAEKAGIMNRAKDISQKKWVVAVMRMPYKDFQLGKTQAATKDTAAPKDEDDGYILSDTNGNPLYNFFTKADDPKAENNIVQALERHVRVDNLRALGNAATDMNKGLELKLIRLKSWNRPPVGSNVCAAVELTDQERLAESRNAPQLKPGEYFYFEISNKTGEQLFPYLYTLGTNGEIKMLYQPPSDGDVLLNGAAMKTLGVRKCSGLFRATPPFGTETFKLIATSERFDGKLLEQPAIARGEIGSKDRGSSPFSKLFAQAGVNQRSEEVTVPFSGWATTYLDVGIIKEQ